MTLPICVFRGEVLRSSVDRDKFMAPDSAKVSFGLSIVLLLAADFWVPSNPPLMKKNIYQRLLDLGYESFYYVSNIILSQTALLDWRNSSLKDRQEMIFCYKNCSDLLWEKIVSVIEKNFWNSRLKAENLRKIWDH